MNKVVRFMRSRNKSRIVASIMEQIYNQIVWKHRFGAFLWGSTLFKPDRLIGTKAVFVGKQVTISGNVFISDTMHNYKIIDVNSMNQDLKYARTEIGDYSFVGYGAVIQAGVVLGKQCIVGSNAVVCEGTYQDYSVLAGVPAKVIKTYNPHSKQWERKESMEH